MSLSTGTGDRKINNRHSKEESTTMEDNFAHSEEPTSASEPSTSKPRRKRRWDQPDESLVSSGFITSGVLPMSSVGSPAVLIPGAVSVSSALLTSSLKASYLNVSKEIQAPLMQQQVAAVLQKLNQPKIQEELMIAREIVINDADPAIRYKLTKRQTQEEIQKCTGTIVITRGKYRPPNAVPDGEKPLYLHISAGAHLKETTERIISVDRAAAMVEEMLKQVSKPLSTCVYLGFDADPSLNIAARIRGPNDQYINHIINETGVTVFLRGCGSGNLGSSEGEEGKQPLHLLLSSNNHKSLEDARLLAENLLDTISRESGAIRVPSCKIYNAVPPPQQLLLGVHSSGTETNPNLNSGSSSTFSTTTSVQESSVGAPMVTTSLPRGQVEQFGPSGYSQTNGFPHSQPLLSTACTSYIGYAGIYPQATPLQQVALALRQSVPVTSTVSPVTSTTSVVPKSFSETGMRPPHKRKFQEAPAAIVGASLSQQRSEIHSRKSPPSMEKENGAVFPPSNKLNHLPSNGTTPPSLKSMLPPPLPRNISSLPLLGAKSMPPPPLPPTKFTSSVSPSRTSDNDSISKKANPTTVPDTLVKLMQYGDDDDYEDDDDLE